MHPDGRCVVTGGRRGALHQWSLLAHEAASRGAAPADSAYCGSSETAHPDSSSMDATGTDDRTSDSQAPMDLRNWCQPLQMEGSGHSDTIDRVVRPEWCSCRCSTYHSGKPPMHRMPRNMYPVTQDCASVGHAMHFVFAAVPQPRAVGDQVFRWARVRLGLAAAGPGHQLEGKRPVCIPASRIADVLCQTTPIKGYALKSESMVDS